MPSQKYIEQKRLLRTVATNGEEVARFESRFLARGPLPGKSAVSVVYSMDGGFYTITTTVTGGSYGGYGEVCDEHDGEQAAINFARLMGESAAHEA